ncbi:MAG: hypothetical protein ACE5Z5_06180, partial [Candidatus Bathyarchaeia archaeon]
MNGTYYFAVKWQNNWVYGNTSKIIDVDTNTVDLVCNVYLIDFTNSFRNLTEPEPSPSFQLVCPNGTTTSPLVAGQYLLQNGTYTWKSIVWKGNNVTPTTVQSFDPVDGDPIVYCNIVEAQIPPPFYTTFLIQYGIPIVLIAGISIVGIMIYRRRKPRYPTKPPTVEVPKPRPIEEIEKKPVERIPRVFSEYDRVGDSLRVAVKVLNDSDSLIADTRVFLDVCPGLEFYEPKTEMISLGIIGPGDFQSAIYQLKPLRCVSGKITGIVRYRDPSYATHEAEVPELEVVSVCPFFSPEGGEDIVRRVKTVELEML